MVDRCREGIERQQLHDAAPVEVQHTEVVRLVQVAAEDLEVRTVLLAGQLDRHRKADELANAFALQTIEQPGILETCVTGEE